MIDRGSITFEQAEGIEPLPSQLQLKEISGVLKSRLWALVHKKIEDCTVYNGSLDDPIRRVARKFVIERTDILVDEWSNQAREITERWKRYFQSHATYAETLGFMEWFVRALNDNQTKGYVANILVYERSAYRLVDNSIVPMASPEEGNTILNAMEKTAKIGLSGARAHLLKASSQLTAGNFADSVRESIHAVEAVIFNKTGITGSFLAGLKEYAKGHPMHPAFSEALVKLYGYTSNEQGVRHSLFDKGDSNVTEQDALFMLGTCASFVTYLL